VRQDEGGQIVHRKAQLVTVAAGLTRRMWRTEPDAGVVDQDVNMLTRIGNLPRETADLVQRREIGTVEFDTLVAGPTANLRNGVLSFCVRAGRGR